MTIETAQSLNLRRLYHYQSFAIPERLTRILIDRKIYFSDLANLNDPWDCRPFFRTSNLDEPSERDRVIRWFTEVDLKWNTSLSGMEHIKRCEKLRNDPSFLKAQVDQLTGKMYESVRKQYRIYCLSQHSDCPLMWAHYSDSCRGFCLEFSAQTGFFGEALKVEYLKTYPHLDPAETDDFENSRLFIRKSEAWKYENEFRLIVTQHPYTFQGIPSTVDGFVSLQPGTLLSVIIGPMMPAEDRKLLLKLAKGAPGGIQLKEVIVMPDRYGFKICELEANSIVHDGTRRG